MMSENLFAKKISSQPTSLFCRLCWSDSACNLFYATTTHFFLEVCPPALSAAVLKLLLPPTTSAISGAANSDKSAPTHFAAETTLLRKKGITVPSITCSSAPNPLLRYRPKLL